MHHLTLETLARIADGPATDDERSHLDACPACRRDLAALRDQATALRSLRPPVPPAGLRARVLDAARAGAGTGARRRFPASAWLARAAAAAAIFLAGALVGAAGDDPADPPSPAGERARAVPLDPAVELERAEALYLDALLRYATLDGSGDPTARLAALESILQTTRAARGYASDDPVVDGVYRAALVGREAILSEVDAGDEQGWF